MPVRWAFLLVMLYAGNAYASDSDVARQVNQPPDADFLEFLGEWETTDGAWFDPLPENKNEQRDDQDKEKQDEAS